MSQDEAQRRVVQLLEGVCPQLKEVVLNDMKEEERLREHQKPKENGYGYYCEHGVVSITGAALSLHTMQSL